MKFTLVAVNLPEGRYEVHKEFSAMPMLIAHADIYFKLWLNLEVIVIPETMEKGNASH